MNKNLVLDEKQTIKVGYEQEDFPVDLYLIMDLSSSMEGDKEKLSALGDKLSKTMRGITSKFRLGFGSFGDKVGFHNIMSLSTDASGFTVS